MRPGGSPGGLGVADAGTRIGVLMSTVLGLIDGLLVKTGLEITLRNHQN